MRIQVQELTLGCGEWCACLFDRFGQPIHFEKSTQSKDDALHKLEDELKRCVNTVYGSSGCAGSVGISPSVPRAFTAPASKLGMTFEQAKMFEMPFGKYKGETLDDIAKEVVSDDGLRYLDWMRNAREKEGKNSDVDKALRAYLDDPSIQQELEDLTGTSK